MDDIHSCSYFCNRPECIKAQRDELRDRLPLDLEHEPADLAEAKEMLRRAKALTFTSLDGLHRAMKAAKQQAEPVAWLVYDGEGWNPGPAKMSEADVPLYTAPQQQAEPTYPSWYVKDLHYTLDKIALAIGLPERDADKMLERIAKLAQQQAEPVAWIDPRSLEWLRENMAHRVVQTQLRGVSGNGLVPLYASPQPRITAAQVEQLKLLADEYARAKVKLNRVMSPEAMGSYCSALDKSRAALHAALDALVAKEK